MSQTPASDDPYESEIFEGEIEAVQSLRESLTSWHSVSADGWLAPPPQGLTREEVDELKASFLASLGGPVIVLPPGPPLWRRWWEWSAAQWWWYLQYKRADRRAFRRECQQARWREAWKGDR